MGNLQDLKHLGLSNKQGVGGHVQDIEHEFLVALTGFTGDNQDLWHDLFDQFGIAAGAFNDRAFAFFDHVGIDTHRYYDGSFTRKHINEMWYDFWMRMAHINLADSLTSGKDFLGASGDVYQRNGIVNVPSTSDGRDTIYTELPAHVLSGKPRTLVNLLRVSNIYSTGSYANSTGTSDLNIVSVDGSKAVLIENHTSVSSASTGKYMNEVSSTIVGASTSIENRTFRFIFEIKASAASEVGKTCAIRSSESTGTSATGTYDIEVTLTDKWETYAMDPFTGAAGSVGLAFGTRGTAANRADEFYIRNMTFIELTGRNDQGPVLPIPVDTPTGPNLWDDTPTPGAGWTDNGDGTFTCDGTSGNSLLESGLLTIGKGYIITLTVDSISAGEVRAWEAAKQTTIASATGTYSITWTPSGSADLNILSVNFNGTISNVSVKEATTGVLESDYTNNLIAFNDGTVTDEAVTRFENDGTAQNNFTIADTFTMPSGNIILAAWVDPSDWTGSGTFMSQQAGAGDRNFIFDLNGGTLRIVTYANGTNSSVTSVSVSSLNGPHWVVLNVRYADGEVDSYKSATIPWDADLSEYSLSDFDVILLNDSYAVSGLYDAATTPIEIGTAGEGGSNPLNGKLARAVLIDGDDIAATPLINFDARTAIQDGWNGKSTGPGQIRTNKALPLHDKVKLDAPGAAPVKRYAVYEHFPLSTSMEIARKYISSLANATYPNGSQGIYNKVAALPNLLAPRSRAFFANVDATVTGTGYCTDIVGAETVMYESDFSSGVDGWGQYIGDANLILTGNETAPDGTTECLKMLANGGAKGLQVAHQSGAVTEIPGRVYKLEYDIYVPAGALQSANTIMQVGYGSAPATQYVAQYGVNYTEGQWVSCTSLTVNVGANASSLLRMVGTVGLATYTSTGIAANQEIYFKNIRISTMDIYSDIEYSVFDDQHTDTYRAYFEKLSNLNGSKIMQAEFILGKGTAGITDIVVNATSFTGGDIWRIDWSNPSATPTFYGAYSATEDTDITWEMIGQDSEGGEKYKLTITTKTEVSGTYFETYIYGAGFDNNAVGTVKVYADMAHRQISATAEPTWNTLKPGDSVTQLVLQQQDFNTTWSDTGTPVKTQDQTSMRGDANTAWRCEDDDAAVSEFFSQTVTGVTVGDDMVVGVALKKQATTTCYPGLSYGAGVVNITMDPVEGRVIATTADTGSDSLHCLDGAVLKALLPDEYPNADEYWIIWSQFDAVATSDTLSLVPARRSTFDNGTTTSTAVGEVTFDEPFCHKGNMPYFFDSVATTAQVTEEIQDWSKIFTFLSEGSNNVTNMVFTHGFHRALGLPNVTGLTNTIGTPYHITSTEAAWNLSGSVGSQTDSNSVLPGEKSNLFVSGGASGNMAQTVGTLTGSKETLAVLFEDYSVTPDKLRIGIYDSTAVAYARELRYTYATGAFDTTFNPAGTNGGEGKIELGTGPNGGRLWLMWLKTTPTNSGNTRVIVIKPYGDNEGVTGCGTYVHAAWHVESDVVSILPFTGTRVAHSKWEYDIGNLSDAAGALLADLIPTLSKANMDLPAARSIVGDSASLLYFDSAEDIYADDGTSFTTTGITYSATDVLRAVTAWSSAQDELCLGTNNVDGGNVEDASPGTYDDSLDVTALDVFVDYPYEAFLLNLILTKTYQDSTARSASTEYDV